MYTCISTIFTPGSPQQLLPTTCGTLIVSVITINDPYKERMLPFLEF